MNRAIELLKYSLIPVPHELNELDWKEDLSPKSEKLTHHLSAFANCPGGGFMVFGIENKTGIVTGVNKESSGKIIERLSTIGRDTLDPQVIIDHAVENYDGKPLLFVFIKESATKPVRLISGSLEDTWIRSGGCTRKASRQEVGGLMLNSKVPQFEELHVSKLKKGIEILDLLDYRTIMKLLNKPLPQSSDEILKWMIDEKMIEQIQKDGYYITNFGALAAANQLKDFDSLSRKTIRVIKYKGTNKIDTEREIIGVKGYAIGFEGLIDYLLSQLPASEIIQKALRTETRVYPEIAIRELIANAIIHQDFTIRGAGPMIEIFDDRVEISNPGKLLPSKKVDRLIGTTPESRNEILAAAFRRYKICEERGSGFEKAVVAIELYGLPPLKMEELENAFKVTMYKPKTFAEMLPQERIEACYQHSIIKFLSGSALTNTSLRERFKMHEKQRPQVSIVIKEAMQLGKIKLRNPESDSTKFTEYIPYWG
jgi:predicted HTH transcriptional regulator